jgi:hypothetical protein
MLFVDGGNDRVGIGRTPVGVKLDILGGNGDQLKLDNSGERFTQQYWQHNGSPKGAIWVDSTDAQFEIYGYAGYGTTIHTNATERANFKSTGEVVFNDISADYDFRVESDGNTHMLFVDGGNNKIGINNSSPASLLDVIEANNVKSHVSARYNTSNRKVGLNVNNSNGQGFLASNANQVSASGAATYDIAGKAAKVDFADGIELMTSVNGSAGATISYVNNLEIDTTGSVFNEAGVDLDFRVESDNNSHMLFVDGGNNKVGIGTGTPSTNFVVSNSGAEGIEFIAGSTNYIQSYNRNGSAYLPFKIDASSISLAPTASSEVVINDSGVDADFRVESDGNAHMLFVDGGNNNVLLGKASLNIGVAGVEFRGASSNYFTTSGDTVLGLNRLSTDGPILEVRKDSSIIGNLAVSSGAYLSVRSNGGNLRLGANNSDYWSIDEYRIYPVNDAVDDIGLANNRVKDLYLSGGVFLGGTGTANKLDDYEEVNFTATLQGSTATPSTLVTVTGFATKIGRVVQYSIGFENVNTTGYGGAVSITGLPFANNGGRAIGNIVGYVGLTFTNTQSFSVIGVGTTIIEALNISSASAWANSTHNATNGGAYFWLTGTYITTA